MSLALIGFITILLVLILMFTKKLTPTACLILIPAVACVIAGQAGSLGEYIVSGVKTVAPTTVMFMFAIIFFNSMMDAGTFDPLINAAIRFAGNDPVKITIATVLISVVGHMDGSGITTTLITCAAMLPIYRKMHLRLLNLIILCALTQGLINIVPWGGPTLRAMTVYNATTAQIFNPLIIPMAAGLAAIIVIAVLMGRKDARRLAMLSEAEKNRVEESEETGSAKGAFDDVSLKRPKNTVINLILIVAAIAAMVTELLPPCPVMMFASIIGLLVNYRDPKIQNELIAKYGAIVLNMATIMFAAGVFTGVLSGSGMLDSMAETLAAAIPASIGRLTPMIVGIAGVPASMIFTPDAWYYSILPTITTAMAGAGVDALSVARASLLGQMTLGFPGSPLLAGSFLLPAMIDMEFPDYQKAWFPYAWGVSLFMLVVALICGCVIM